MFKPVFGNPYPNPFENGNMELMKLQLELLLASINKVLSASTSTLEEINTVLLGMNAEELSMLSKDLDFIQAKSLYEVAFMDFLGSKFALEYVSSPNGKAASENLLKAVLSVKGKISAELLNRLEKVNMMLTLLEKDPDIKKKYDDMILKNGK